MVGIYFSGTGNTKHCVTRLVGGLEKNAKVYAMEDKNSVQAIDQSDTVIFGYPVQYSNLPKIVREYINKHKNIFYGKNIFIVATMGLFSGDGAGRSAKLFKKYGANILGGLHLKMPDCIGDVAMLKKTMEENQNIISEADKKIDRTVLDFQNNHYPKDGLSFLHKLAGLFGQRLYFANKTKHFYSGIKVDNEKCVKCGLCTRICPMQNVSLTQNEIKFSGRCTMCYRCFSQCPQKAITVLGKRVIEQCTYEGYAGENRIQTEQKE